MSKINFEYKDYSQYDAKTKHTSNQTINDLYSRIISNSNIYEYRSLIQFIARYQDFAIYNNLLAWLQNPNVVYYLPASNWKDQWDRTIKRNAKPILIQYVKGPVNIVYDLLDTIGAESYQEFLSTNFDKTKKTESVIYFFEVLKYTLKNNETIHINVEFDDNLEKEAGATYSRINESSCRITISKSTELEENIKILLQAVGHIMLGHWGSFFSTEEKKEVSISSRDTVAPEMINIEIDTFAYLIAERFGLSLYPETFLIDNIVDPSLLTEIDIDGIVKRARPLERGLSAGIDALSKKRSEIINIQNLFD